MTPLTVPNIFFLNCLYECILIQSSNEILKKIIFSAITHKYKSIMNLIMSMSLKMIAVWNVLFPFLRIRRTTLLVVDLQYVCNSYPSLIKLRYHLPGIWTSLYRTETVCTPSSLGTKWTAKRPSSISLISASSVMPTGDVTVDDKSYGSTSGKNTILTYFQYDWMVIARSGLVIEIVDYVLLK